jgi:16S rRNA (adenine1518-N6/adenine1519-N6)-dimethyltransferase
MSARDPFAVFRARMDALGFRPSSVLGQNFLLDPSLHRWIAERAAATPADTVVEIGVGLGFLTRELAARAGRVVAVEIDERLLQLAREDLGGLANVAFVHGDALGGDGRSLHPAIAAARPAGERGAVLVVANLPYAVSGPLLAELCALPLLPERAVVLVQKELGAKIAAAPGSADYGGLSALVQALFTARCVRDVPPDVFRPRPKVASTVLELHRRPDAALGSVTAGERRAFARFVRQLFQQRRKALRTTLAAAAAAAGRSVPGVAAEELGKRAEQIPPDTLAGWFLQSGATG